MRRMLCTLLLALMVTGAVIAFDHAPHTTFAQDPATGTVTVAELNVRLEPATSAPIVSTLSLNTRVQVLGHEDFHTNGALWLYVTTNNAAGWVDSAYVRLDGIRSAYDQLSVYYGPAANGFPYVVQSTRFANIPLYASPDTSAATVGTVPPGSLLGVNTTGIAVSNGGAAMINTIPGANRDGVDWLEVTYLQTGEVGWVTTNVLGLPFLLTEAQASNRSIPVPTSVIFDIPAGGLPVEGHVLVGLSDWNSYSWALYETPGGDVKYHVPRDIASVFAVHGRAAGTRWFYITQVGGGYSGWIYQFNLWNPPGFTFRNLPLLEPVAVPVLPPSAATINALALRTTRNTSIHTDMRLYYQDAAIGTPILANTPVTAVGRTIWGNLIEVEWEGMRGWVEARALGFDTTTRIYQLPITAAGPYFNEFEPLPR